MAGPLTVLGHVLKPFRNLVASRPVLATLWVNLRCHFAVSGYCDLPINVGRDKILLEEIQQIFFGLYRDTRFLRGSTGSPS